MWNDVYKENFCMRWLCKSIVTIKNILRRAQKTKNFSDKVDSKCLRDNENVKKETDSPCVIFFTKYTVDR